MKCNCCHRKISKCDVCKKAFVPKQKILCIEGFHEINGRNGHFCNAKCVLDGMREEIDCYDTVVIE